MNISVFPLHSSAAVRILDRFGNRVRTTRKRVRPAWMKNILANLYGAGTLHRMWQSRKSRRKMCGWRELNRVHMSPKARVSPGRESACISGVHPYADPHWYDNIYILHIRSGPYTRIANSPLLAFGHQCVWLTLLVAPLTPDYISICIHSRTSLSPPARLYV